MDEYGMYAFAWVFILDNKGKTSQSKTGIFYLPKAVVDLVNEGMELGRADDLIFNRENSKQQGGSVGILTHEVEATALHAYQGEQGSRKGE